MFSLFRRRPRRAPGDAAVIENPLGRFPRTDYAHQAPLSAANIRGILDPKPNLEFAARIASMEWARVALLGTWRELDEDLFKLAVLDKVFEL